MNSKSTAPFGPSWLSSPEHALVLCCFDPSQEQAQDRTRSGLSMKKGRAGTMPTTKSAMAHHIVRRAQSRPCFAYSCRVFYSFVHLTVGARVRRTGALSMFGSVSAMYGKCHLLDPDQCFSLRYSLTAKSIQLLQLCVKHRSRPQSCLNVQSRGVPRRSLTGKPDVNGSKVYQALPTSSNINITFV